MHVQEKKKSEGEQAALEEKLESLLFKNRDLEHEKDRYLKELDVFKRSFEGLDHEKSATDNESLSNEEKYSKYRMLIEEAKINQKRIQLLESEIDELKKVVKNKEEEIHTISTANKEKLASLSNEHSKQIQDEREQNQRFKQSMQHLQARLDSLQDTHERELHENQQIQKEKSSLEEKIKESANELKKYVENLKTEEARNKELSHSLELIKTEKIKESADDLSKYIENLRIEEARNKDLTQSLELFKTENLNLKVQKDEIEKKLKLHEDAEKSFKNEKIQTEQRVHRYELTNSELIQKQEALIKENNLYLKENENLQKSIESLQDKLIKKKGSDQTVVESNERANAQIKGLEAELNQHKESYTQALQNLKEEMNRKLVIIAEEVKDILSFLFNESFEVSALSSMNDDSPQVEQTIHNYLSIIKRRAIEQLRYSSKFAHCTINILNYFRLSLEVQDKEEEKAPERVRPAREVYL